MIQAPKLEPQIIRYELSGYEWTAIKPKLPNKPRGVARVKDRRRLNGIFWVLRSGAPWRDLPESYGPYHGIHNTFSDYQTPTLNPAGRFAALAGSPHKGEGKTQVIPSKIILI